jgi:hypothetical protein
MIIFRLSFFPKDKRKLYSESVIETDLLVEKSIEHWQWDEHHEQM